MSDMSGGPALAVPQAADPSADEWRGRCLNLFARGELAVLRTLEVGRESGLISKIPHLAGQRIAALQVMTGQLQLTEKQVLGLDNSIGEWQRLEQRRLFLAHGVMRLAFEPRGKWVLLLDVRVHRAQRASDDRWTVTQEEAGAFHAELEAGYLALSQRLGLVRTGVGNPKPD